MAVVPLTPLEIGDALRIDNPELADSLNGRNNSFPILGFQGSSPTTQTTNTDDNHLLVVSPYGEEPHLLDLRTLDTPNQLLAKALVGLECLRDDYATAPYAEIFNWSEVVEQVGRLAAVSGFKWKETSFYIVVFRSRIPPTTVYASLGVLDKAAHAEATRSGGFLKYWFGSPDPKGRNLATCVWRNAHDARAGSVGEAHRKAAVATRTLYCEWEIERLRLLIKDDAKGFAIDQWVDEA